MNKYNYYLLILMMLPFTAVHAVRIPHYKGYRLVWHDEFNRDGRLDSTSWNYETGFQRNEEDQWYQYDNAFCQNGNLVIEARREHRPNPDYGKTADWRNRQYISYTSASVNTRGKRSFTYGRFEVRARIPAFMGQLACHLAVRPERRGRPVMASLRRNRCDGVLPCERLAHHTCQCLLG